MKATIVFMFVIALGLAWAGQVNAQEEHYGNRPWELNVNAGAHFLDTGDTGAETDTDVGVGGRIFMNMPSGLGFGGSFTYVISDADFDDDPLNNTDSAAITIVVGALGVPETGFAPGRVTRLPSQPAEETYVVYDDLWLEIPKLDLQTSIAGIPQSGGGWDVSWLGEQVGYLNGTAFPTWAGNSVITAHVTLSNGEEGPFADLKSLRFGDRVVVHGWGQRYIYEIRAVELVSPADRDVFRHEERSWLTLVTCHGYDERENAYRWRVAARAVLIQIDTEVSPDRPTPRSEE